MQHIAHASLCGAGHHREPGGGRPNTVLIGIVDPAGSVEAIQDRSPEWDLWRTVSVVDDTSEIVGRCIYYCTKPGQTQR